MTDYTVYSGTYLSVPLQTARDILELSRDDYFFCRVSEDKYILIECDNWNAASLSSDDCTVSEIYYTPVTRDTPSTYQVFCRDHQAVTVHNPDNFLVYGSQRGLPHLRDGGDQYAYALLLLCSVQLALVGFAFVWRLFLKR